MLAFRVVIRIDPESEPVVRVAADVAVDGPFVLLDVAPHHGDIFPFDAMLEELSRQVELSFIILCDHQQA